MKKTLKLFFDTVLQQNSVDDITLKNNPLVVIFVVRKIDYKRYELSIKNKKIVCISYKKLDISKYYWCNIYKDENDMTVLSNLTKQPDIFQKNYYPFFRSDIDTILKIIESKNCKKDFLKFIKANYSKNMDFLKKIIYLLDINILTFPLIIKNEKIFLQFQIMQNDTLNEKTVRYYIGFQNFGPFEGIFKNRQGRVENKIFVKYKNIMNFFNLDTKNDIIPLNNNLESFLDIKG